MVKSSHLSVDTAKLAAKHEEADTRIVLHCIHILSPCIVVQATDTDVLVLLLANISRFPCTTLWVKCGTAKKRKYICIQSLVESLPFGPTVLETLPALHALTGTDTTSFLYGIGKKHAWKVFQKHHELLKDLGNGCLTEKTMKDAEVFVCRLFKMENLVTTDMVRTKLFTKCHSPESLPPTSDALGLHIM